MIVARDLAISETDVHKEFGIKRGAHFHMSWIQKTYNKLVAVRSSEVVARVYMLHLMTCTLFTNKPDVYINADTCACSVASRLPVGHGGVLC